MTFVHIYAIIVIGFCAFTSTIRTSLISNFKFKLLEDLVMNKITKVLLLLFASLLIFGCQKTDTQKTEEKKPVPITREERVIEAKKEVADAVVNALPKTVKVDLSTLTTYKLGDLYADYLGLKRGGKAPNSVEVSFEERMATLYQKKVSFERCNKKGVCKEASDTVLVQMPKLYKEYLAGDKQKMSFKDFVGVADRKVVDAKKSLDWEKVCKRYQPKVDQKGLNEKKCTLFKGVASKIVGKDMIAYGMTELLPSSEGRLNVPYTEVILKNAGASFLYHVPALGDELASLGFYQFTMYALRKDEEVIEGASIINSFVKDGGEKIPDSVVYLKGDQQHVAAFYFAVHNIARLVFSLSEKGVKALSGKHHDYQDEMVMYVAAAHHAPTDARKMTAKWINAGMSNGLLDSYGGHRIRRYAGKTKANLLAIYETLFPRKEEVKSTETSKKSNKVTKSPKKDTKSKKTSKKPKKKK